MAFPAVSAQPTHSSVAGETQFTLTWPVDVQRGDLLCVFAGSGHDTNSPCTDAGDGDLRQYSHAYFNDTGSTTSDCSSGLWYKRANGNEGGTSISNVAGAPDPGRTVHGFVIRGADEYTAPDVAFLRQTPAGANPNPPSNTAAWGSDDNLWLVHCVGATTADITGTLTNYSDQTELTGNAATGACRSVAAWRQLAAASEDPPALTRASWDYIAQTVAVRPKQANAHAKVRHFTAYETDATFPNDVTVTVEGGNGTVLVCGVVGASLDSGSPVLTLDPSGLNITLTQCTDGVTTSHIDGAVDMRLYRVPSPVPAGSYTLRGSRSSGSGVWGIYWIELGDCGNVIDVTNATGTVGASDVSGTVDGQAGSLAVALVHAGATFAEFTANLLGGVPPMGYGEIDHTADGNHSSCFIGRATAGSNAFTFDGGTTVSVTALVTVVTFGYAPANQNAPFLAAAA